MRGLLWRHQRADQAMKTPLVWGFSVLSMSRARARCIRRDAIVAVRESWRLEAAHTTSMQRARSFQQHLQGCRTLSSPHLYHATRMNDIARAPIAAVAPDRPRWSCAALRVLKREPILFVTLVICALVHRHLGQLLVLRRFGLPILEYLQASDFLVAGLRDPIYLWCSPPRWCSHGW